MTGASSGVGVSFTIGATDSVSGITNVPGAVSEVTNTTTYWAMNGAGLTNSCKVTVTKTATKWTRNTYKCTKGTYGSGTTSYVSSCSAQSETTANANNSASYWTCATISVQANNASGACTKNGLSAPCYAKTTHSRTGCSTYSSSASSTLTNQTSCTASSGSYYKYTCTETAWTYSGSCC